MTVPIPAQGAPARADHPDHSGRAERLRKAAAPVLEELVTHLRDTSLGIALADRDSVIIETRVTGDRTASADQLIPAGASGRADDRISCYVQSIHHPLTGEVVGALIISGAIPQTSSLFMPYLGHAVKDIAQRLLEGSPEEQLVLAWFRDAARDRSCAVVALCDEMLLTTQEAADMLWPGDRARLRGLARDVPDGRALTRTIELTSGQVVEVRATRVPGTPGVLFRLVGRSRRGAACFRVQHQLRRLRGTRFPVVISGEPGTGRTHALQALAGGSRIATLDAAEVPACGEGAWARRLHALEAESDGVIAIEEIQLLPPTLCVRLATMLASSSGRFVLTSSPYDDLPRHVADLASSCMHRVELPPLRHRRDELPELFQTMLQEASPRDDLDVDASVLAALVAHPWPGNLRELAMVVRHAAASGSTGMITLADLPEGYRAPASSQRLTPWQQAEHDAIVSALRATAGNKLQAAGRLGISRTTLYNRIRGLGITV